MMTDKFKVLEEFQRHDDWYIKSFHARILPFFVQVLSILKMVKVYPWVHDCGGCICEPDNLITWFWKESEMLRARTEFIGRVLEDERFLNEYELLFFRKWDAYLNAEEKYCQQKDLTIQEQVRLLVDLIETEKELAGQGYINDCFLSVGNQDWIMDYIDDEVDVGVNGRNRIISDLITPVHPSFIQEEQIDLQNIGLQSVEKQQSLLEEHLAKWSWIEQSYFESEELKVGDFSMKLKELKVGEIVPTTVYLEKEKRMARKNAAIEQIQASDKLKTVLDMSDRLSHITDLRKLAVLRLNRLIFKFMQEYSKKESVKYELVSWLLPTELLDVVQTGDWAKIEERRSSGLMMLFKSKKTLFFQGDELRGLDLTSFTKADTSAKKLSGQVAFKGQVKARAVVVRSRNDFKRFNKGDILVTNQTTPEFVPLMRKAAAAITEQGGITCHAAIVARELELPCIIGVSNATRIIKDGAIIKVDAIKGVIELGNKE